MTHASLKSLLAGTAVAIVAAIAVAPSAQAACWWSGGDWNCTTPPPPGAVIAPPIGGYVYVQGGQVAIPGQAADRYPGPKTSR